MPKPKKEITEFRNYYLPVDFPVVLLTGNTWWITDKPSDHLHFHNCLEIGFCHEGSGILQLRGQRFYFQKNDITFIARNVPHTTYSSPGTESRWSYLFVDLNEMLSPFSPASSQQISKMLEQLNEAQIIRSEQNPDIAFYVGRLIEEIDGQPVHYQSNARALFFSLLVELYREDTRIEKEVKNDSQQQNHSLAIVPALEYIKHNYMNQFSVETLADLCGLSPTHFRRVFNNTMGVSPLEYLNTLRITKACYLLRSTEDSILNISESVGFHSISSFNRYFDRLVNMSPREYRHSSMDEAGILNAKIMKFNGWMQPE